MYLKQQIENDYDFFEATWPVKDSSQWLYFYLNMHRHVAQAIAKPVTILNKKLQYYN